MIFAAVLLLVGVGFFLQAAFTSPYRGPDDWWNDR